MAQWFVLLWWNAVADGMLFNLYYVHRKYTGNFSILDGFEHTCTDYCLFYLSPPLPVQTPLFSQIVWWTFFFLLTDVSKKIFQSSNSLTFLSANRRVGGVTLVNRTASLLKGPLLSDKVKTLTFTVALHKYPLFD